MWAGAGIREAGTEDDMDDTGKIKRRPDGSIDTDHYRGLGRRLRSATARRWLQELVDILCRRRANPSTGPASGDGQP
jgi:hypothetical protein